MIKDTVWSAYYEDSVRLADVINGLVATGKLLVEPNDFVEKDTKSIPPKRDESGEKKSGYAWSGAMQRDIVRKFAKGVCYFIVGLENQEFIDYEIPLRIMKYDVAEYEKQYKQMKRELDNQKGMTAGEYLYKFRKEDKLVPIVTLILYGGSEKWDGPRCLKDMFDMEEVSKAFQMFVADYKINIIELREIEDTSVFKTDFKQVVDVIKASGDKRKLKEVIENDPAFQSLAPEAYDVIATYVNAKELEKIKKRCMTGGNVDMCKALRELIEDGREEIRMEERTKGRAEGREEGRAEGRAMEIVRLCREFGQTEETILKRLMEELEFKKEEALIYMV